MRAYPIIAAASLAVLGACQGKPEGVTAATTPDKLVGTWNGVHFARGASDPRRGFNVRGWHMGVTYEFSQDSGALGGRAELRPTWAGTDTVEAELKDIAFADGGVNFTIRVTRGEDRDGGDVAGETTGVTLWWIKLPDGAEQLKGSGQGGFPGGGFTARLDRINPK